MFCKNCGAANQDGARFCAGCGAELQAPVQQAPVYQEPVQQPYAAPVQQPAQRPAAAPSNLTPAGIMRMLVVVVTVLSLIFGIMNLFGTYEIEQTTKTVTKTEDDKETDKDSTDVELEEMYEDLEDFEDYIDELKDEDDVKVSGSPRWIQIGNIVFGIVCVVVLAIGALYLLKVFNNNPLYDQYIGKIAKGKSPAFITAGLGAIGALLQILMYLLLATFKVTVESGSYENTSTTSWAPHWTSWVALVVFAAIVAYDMLVLNKKKK